VEDRGSRDGQERRPKPARPQHEPEVFDVHTPTEREKLEASIARRRKRYFRVMIPCLILVGFGFFVPAPTPVRLTALAIAAFMPPIAAMVGNTR
jgi:hypothetical protein